VTGHGAFPVTVTKKLDSSKLKQGDAVEVETAGGFKLADGTLVARGSKLTGHVVASKARSKGDTESELTIAFEKINVANGKQVTVQGSVQAVFPPPDEADPGMPVSTMSKGGGGQTAIPTPDYQPSVRIGSNTGSLSKGEPVVNPKSVGVQGIHDLELNNGVLTSKGMQVKLGNGVRMIVHIDILE
jgi:hypothetical protein